ncbi:MAG: hypothetical protein V9G29_00765 [Burkholderiaceae bacterium]
MQKVTVEELVEASDTLIKLSGMAEGFHTEHPLAPKAVEMKLALQLANLYVLDFCKGISDGDEPESALLKTLDGSRPLPDAAIKAWADAKRLSTN